MEEPAAEEWQAATQRRKAWAKSRDSWQASEAEDPAAQGAERAQDEELEEEEDRPGGKLPPAAEAGLSRRWGPGPGLGWGWVPEPRSRHLGWEGEALATPRE